jgi:hypothetical protein
MLHIYIYYNVIGRDEGPGAVGGGGGVWRMYVCQSPYFKVDPSTTQNLRRRIEIIPVKDFHTRIKPLALDSGHGRYITVTPERTFFSVGVGEWPLHITVINL